MTTTCSTTSCSAVTLVQSTQDGQESSSFPLTPAVFGWAWTKTFKLPSAEKHKKFLMEEGEKHELV